MNINYKQSQFELFPGSPGSSTEAGKPRYLFAHLTLSLENIVVLGIMVVMTLLFSFSLGVEKGKTITELGQPEQKKIAKAIKLPIKPVAAQLAKTTEEPVAVRANKIAVPSELEAPKVENVEPPTDQFINKSDAIQIEDRVMALLPAVVETKNPVALTEVNAYTIQVASYKGDKYANKEADALKVEGFDVYVLQKGDYFIVCVGKFAAKDDANKILGKLKKKYNDLLVRSF